MNWKRLSWKIILLLIIGCIAFLWLIKAPLMSRYLTSKLGVPVSVGSISIWPSVTKIHNFKIRNPRGFKLKDAVRAETTTVNYQMRNLFGNPTEIDEITIDDIYMSIILTSPLGQDNNWTAIAAGMPKNEKKQSESDSHEVVIHRLILSNFNVEIQGGQFIKAPTSKHIDRLEFKELSSKTGFPTKELINAIFEGAGIQQYIKDAFNPNKIFQQWVPKGLFGDASEEAE